MQMVFQDPFGSLDPKWRVTQLVEEPLIAFKASAVAAERRRRVQELLDLVGLDPARYGARRPRQLSGGQAQRVAIARALALNPSLIICDEPVSSLDVLIRAQVLNLLERLRTELGLAYLFIAHDLALVKQVSDRVAVMYLGKLVELGTVGIAVPAAASPLHGRAAGLDSQPRSRRCRPQPIDRDDPGRARRPRSIRPSGCRFRTRCPRAQDICAAQEPPLRRLADGHYTACHFPVAVDAPAPEATAAQVASAESSS